LRHGFCGRCLHPTGAFCKTPLHPKTFIFFRLALAERFFIFCTAFVGAAHTRQGRFVKRPCTPKLLSFSAWHLPSGFLFLRGFCGRCPHPTGAFCKTPLHPKTFIFFRLALAERFFVFGMASVGTAHENRAYIYVVYLLKSNEEILICLRSTVYDIHSVSPPIPYCTNG